MDEIEEVMKVDSEHSVNVLLKAGWRFLQVVYDSQKITDYGFWRSKTVGAKKVAKYLMGRPNGVLPPKEDEYSWGYIQRLQKEQEKKSKILEEDSESKTDN